jgi:hypothetical protein
MTHPDQIRAIITDPRLRRHHADRLLLYLLPTLADGLPHRVPVRRTAARLQIEARYVRLGLALLVETRYVQYVGRDHDAHRWYLLGRDRLTSDTEVAA